MHVLSSQDILVAQVVFCQNILFADWIKKEKALKMFLWFKTYWDLLSWCFWLQEPCFLSPLSDCPGLTNQLFYSSTTTTRLVLNSYETALTKLLPNSYKTPTKLHKTPDSYRLITVIKCLKGLKSLQMLCDGPQTHGEFSCGLSVSLLWWMLYHNLTSDKMMMWKSVSKPDSSWRNEKCDGCTTIIPHRNGCLKIFIVLCNFSAKSIGFT